MIQTSFDASRGQVFLSFRKIQNFLLMQLCNGSVANFVFLQNHYQAEFAVFYDVNDYIHTITAQLTKEILKARWWVTYCLVCKSLVSVTRHLLLLQVFYMYLNG